MKVLSLFGGIETGRQALKELNIPIDGYYSSEIDKYAIAVSTYQHQDIIHLGSVTDWRDWNIDWANIDLITGGFPCQAWSVAGRQLGDKDERGKLFWVMLDIMKHVKSLNPSVKFMIENVKMKKDFEEYITYHTNQALGELNKHLINSALVSAQNRQRYYWTNIQGIEQPEDKGLLLKDIIENGVVNREKSHCLTTRTGQGASLKKYEQQHMHQIVYTNILKVGNINPSDKGMNGNVFDVNGKSPTLTTNKGEGIKITGGAMRGRYLDENGKRLDSTVDSQAGLTTQRIEIRDDGKSNCLSTVQKDSLCIQVGVSKIGGYEKTNRVYGINGKSPALESRDFKDPKRISQDSITWRKLTPLECERLQTLPDNYTALGIMKGKEVNISNSQRYKMCGNGWTLEIIKHIFKNLIDNA